jgi:hypothetical protein
MSEGKKAGTAASHTLRDPKATKERLPRGLISLSRRALTQWEALDLARRSRLHVIRRERWRLLRCQTPLLSTSVRIRRST